MDEYLSANCAHWNEVVPSHARPASYDVEGFKAGMNTLRPIEIEEVGAVSGTQMRLPRPSIDSAKQPIMIFERESAVNPLSQFRTCANPLSKGLESHAYK